MHVDRSRRLLVGETLTQICADFRVCLGVEPPKCLPMSDDTVRTLVETDAGTLAFQEYFVRQQCRPRVRGIRFAGASAARAQRLALEALAAPTLAGVIICPSNPYLSVDPILAVPGIAEALRTCQAPVIAVTPIIARQGRQGADREDHGGARPFGRCVDRRAALFGVDRRLRSRSRRMRGAPPMLALPTLVTKTMMKTLDDKIAFAAACISLCEKLRASRGVDERAGAQDA